MVKVWRRTETGEAPRRQGATTENTGSDREYLREEQRGRRGCIARRMQPDFHPGLLRRRHVAEAVGAQLAAQVEEIALEHGAIDRVFEQQRVEHARERAPFGDELPHPRGDGVQSEVRPGFQVQQDALPIQFTKENVIGNRDRIVQRQVHDGVHCRRLRFGPCRAKGFSRT